MKYGIKITLVLLSMFFIAQMIGLFVVNQYSPSTSEIITPDGEIINVTSYNLPYGLEPPKDIEPANTLVSIIIAIIIAVSLMFFLMKYKFEILLRIWFFVVVIIAIGLTLNSLILKVPYSPIIALALAIPLAIYKVFKRNMIVHNLTELIIYPGIAAIFVPILSIWSVVLLLILISIYDMYAVWHAGFMQKMAQYQIQKVKVFSGFFIPYLDKKQRKIMAKAQKSKSKNLKNKKIKINVAILGGGDVVFPIILAGVVMVSMGIIQAVLVSLGATLALGALFWWAQKGKYYPAMPFITAGCFSGLAIAYLAV